MDDTFWKIASEELTHKIQKKNKKRPITEGEAKGFWRKKFKEYWIAKYLEKTPAQISVWDLLMSFEYHRNTPLKLLDEEYVPKETSDEKPATMVSYVIGSHQISFQENELPTEWVMDNRVLYNTSRCRDKFVDWVLIDNGSWHNIYPL